MKKIPYKWLIPLSVLFIGICVPIEYFTLTSDLGKCSFKASSFTLSWIHSVEHQEWREDYQYRKGKLHLYQTWLKTFGAGTPSQGESIKSIFLPDYIGYKKDIYLPEVNWIVSRNMLGTISTSEWQFPIYQFVSDYSEVTIQPTKSSLAVFLLGRSCNDGSNQIKFHKIREKRATNP